MRDIKPLPSGVWLDLMSIRNTLKLAAFAAEARRTLTQIQAFKEREPEAGARLEQHVDDPDGWQDIEDVSSAVIEQVCGRLDALLKPERT